MSSWAQLSSQTQELHGPQPCHPSSTVMCTGDSLCTKTMAEATLQKPLPLSGWSCHVCPCGGPKINAWCLCLLFSTSFIHSLIHSFIRDRISEPLVSVFILCRQSGRPWDPPISVRVLIDGALGSTGLYVKLDVGVENLNSRCFGFCS